MAYFAIRCVSGRELLVKSYIETAIRNCGRTDVLNIVVPSRTVLDLNKATNKRSNAELTISYRSYIFLNVESQTINYVEMSGDLYQFLSNIPNVVQIITTNLPPSDIKWLEEQDASFVVFKVDNVNKEISTQAEIKTNSVLTKIQEKIEKNKVITTFKRFVQSFSQPKNKGLSYIEKDGEMTILANIELVMEALFQTKLTMSELLNAPYKLLHLINNVFSSYAYNR
jgi:transcription antitermination factor NusG